MAERLERGIADGQVRAETDCLAWARYVGGVVQGLSVQARDAAPAAALAATARIAAQSLEALRAAPAKRTPRRATGKAG